MPNKLGWHIANLDILFNKEIEDTLRAYNGLKPRLHAATLNIEYRAFPQG